MKRRGGEEEGTRGGWSAEEEGDYVEEATMSDAATIRGSCAGVQGKWSWNDVCGRGNM